MDSMGYLGIFVALIGLVGALLAGLGWRRARALTEAAQRWLDAPGKVLAASAERRGGGSATSRNAYYAPLIRYAYVVNGREREGSRLRFGLTTARSRGGAEKLLAPYPVGAAIKVRYDPENPDQSVLEPGRTSSNLLFAAIACFLLLLGGAAIVVMAVKGVFSADVSGRWHVRFIADGVTYEGDLDAVRGAGPLVLSYTTPQGPRHAREDCTLTRNRQHVLVRCANPVMIDGNGNYVADNFDLTYQGASRLTGRVTSEGQPAGTATFTR
jgi:hypothetical protein